MLATVQIKGVQDADHGLSLARDLEKYIKMIFLFSFSVFLPVLNFLFLGECTIIQTGFHFQSEVFTVVFQ